MSTRDQTLDAGEEIFGTITRIAWPRSEKDLAEKPFRIFYIEREPGMSVCVKGEFPEARKGMQVACEGVWTTHPTHGKSLNARTIQERFPVGNAAIVRYLAKAKLKGVGLKTAKRIVDIFGEHTFHIIDREPQRLQEIKGIPASTIESITAMWGERRAEHRVKLFLQAHDVPPAMSRSIHNYLDKQGIPSTKHIDEIRKDPYRISYARGVGFATADRLARALGVDLQSPSRIAAGAIHILNERNKNEGHTICALTVLAAKTATLLEMKRQDELIFDVITTWAQRPEWNATLIEQDGTTYAALRYIHLAEKNLARSINRLLAKRPLISDPDHPLLHRTFRLSNGDLLNDQQAQAVRYAYTFPISIITGGPGTGKTSTARAIIETADSFDFDVLCNAPTGLAAIRLQEAARYPATTMHRTAGIGRPDRHTVRIIPDLNISDEQSMTDVVLGDVYLCNANPGSWVLMGDINQLPSVGAGNVLRDLIECGRIPVTRLETIYRQGKGSRGAGIVQASHDIINGRLPKMTETDFRLFEPNSQTYEFDGATLITKIAKRLLKDGVAPETIQVLAPMNDGSMGVEALNFALQAALNPAQPHIAEIPFGDGTLRTGDRIIQRKNDDRRGIVNGDIGYVVEIDVTDRSLLVVFSGDRLVEIPRQALGQIQLAYAISIHRSQGSEFRVVIMPMTKSHYRMLNRNLIYTAVTRARERCYMIGTMSALQHAVRTQSNEKRETALKALLLAS